MHFYLENKHAASMLQAWSSKHEHCSFKNKTPTEWSSRARGSLGGFSKLQLTKGITVQSAYNPGTTQIETKFI